jgi:hypothetical protein
MLARACQKLCLALIIMKVIWFEIEYNIKQWFDRQNII